VASKISICNRALIYIGGNSISSIDEGSREANLCKAVFDDVRDEVLQMHPWDEARARQELAQLSDAPAFGYSYKYNLPTDPYCLKVLTLNEDTYGQSAAFTVEGRELLTDEDTAQITYTSRLTDPRKFSPLLATTIAAALGAAIALKLSTSTSLAETAFKFYIAKLAEARGENAQQGTARVVTQSSFLTVRS